MNVHIPQPNCGMYTFNGYLLLNVHIQHLGHWMYTFNTWAIESIHSTVIYIQYNIYIQQFWQLNLHIQWQIIAYTHSMIWPSNGHIPELEPLNVHIPQLCTCKICTKKVWISSFHLKEGAQGLTLTLCFSTGWFEALPKVGEWVIWEKLAICNTSRDNSHILIFSRRVIGYGSETSPSEGPCKKFAICNTFQR